MNSDTHRRRSRKIGSVVPTLTENYGHHEWRSHGDPVSVLIGTVLSQHTSDINTARAFARLRERLPTWEEVASAPEVNVADAIRSGGLAAIKAPRIQRILRTIEAECGVISLEHLRHLSETDARALLIALPGVGPKTATCVLLFSLGRPAMPVDTHVHRVSKRLGLIDPTTTAEAAHLMLDALLGDDVAAVYDVHLNLIAHGRAVCKARLPLCERCPLTEACDYYNLSSTARNAIG